jgi:hypothetical protein
LTFVKPVRPNAHEPCGQKDKDLWTGHENDGRHKEYALAATVIIKRAVHHVIPELITQRPERTVAKRPNGGKPRLVDIRKTGHEPPKRPAVLVPPTLVKGGIEPLPYLIK